MPRTTCQKKPQLWTERFEQFQRSQQNVQQFCASLGCTPTTFHYWKRKLQPTGQLTSDQANSDQANSSAFLPVVLRGSTSQPVVVRVKDGTRITVPVGALATLEIILKHAQRVAR